MTFTPTSLYGIPQFELQRFVTVSPARRMEDHIRSLCREVIESDGNSEDFRIAAAELQSALSKHIGQIRERLKKYPLTGQERRKTQ